MKKKDLVAHTYVIMMRRDFLIQLRRCNTGITNLVNDRTEREKHNDELVL